MIYKQSKVSYEILEFKPENIKAFFMNLTLTSVLVKKKNFFIYTNTFKGLNRPCLKKPQENDQII